MTTRSFRRCLIALCLAVAACSDASSSGSNASDATSPAPFAEVITTPRRLDVTSKSMTVRGEFRSLAVDRVEGLQLADGRLVARGSASTVLIEVPAADLAHATRRWTLVTDANLEAGKLLVFTHEESLDEVEVTRPPTDATVRFAVFEGRDGGEVLVLAWGESSRSYWGWVSMRKS